MSKLRPETWNEMSRYSKIAACMYNSLVPDHIKAEARTINYGEGKGDPLTARAGNVRYQQQTGVRERNYDRVPGLRRKRR